MKIPHFSLNKIQLYEKCYYKEKRVKDNTDRNLLQVFLKIKLGLWESYDVHSKEYAEPIPYIPHNQAIPITNLY